MPPSFFGDRLLIPHHVVTRMVEGATVLLNTKTGRYFALDEVGSRVWTLLNSSSSAQVAHDTLLAEYSVAPEQLKADLETLIQSLESQGLIEVLSA